MTDDVGTRQVTANGTEVPVQIGGKGPRLLYLHGAGGAGQWTEAHQRLAGSFTVYAPVHPGFGGTPLPDWVDGADDLAFHTIDLVAELGLRRPLIVGASLGGYIATEMAIFRPELAAGLVLVDAVGLRPDQPMPDLFIMDPFEALSVLFNDPSKVMATMPASGPDVDFIVRQYEEQAATARVLWQRAYDPKLERRLHHITAPTLVLWGADDRLLPPAHGEKLAKLLPNARFQLIDGCGHVPPIEAPDAFAAAVIDFAATLDLGG